MHTWWNITKHEQGKKKKGKKEEQELSPSSFRNPLYDNRMKSFLCL